MNKREVLSVSAQSEYFAKDGLRSKTGLDELFWDYAVLKELLDNSLDAIDRQRDKRIEIICGDQYLGVFDNGSEFDEEKLDKIHNKFDEHVSSKRLYKSCTRGFQGNALKTIEGICYIKKYHLSFQSGGWEVSYNVNPRKLRAGIVEFSKDKKQTNDTRKGVIVTGISLHEVVIESKVLPYRMSNPDVTFKLNDSTMRAVSAPVVRTKTYIHWYDLEAFNALLQAMNRDNPNKTIVEFKSEFSGTRPVSLKELPYKRLSEISDDDDAIEELYWTIKDGVLKPTPQILTKFISGKDNLLEILKIYGYGINRYKRALFGEYTHNEAQVPYAIEGFLLNSQGKKYSSGKILTAVNNSITYDDCPFYWVGREVELLTEKRRSQEEVIHLKSLLEAADFRSARGKTLYVHLVTPHLEFLDMAKTKINVTGFKDVLLKLIADLLKEEMKEIKKKKKLFLEELAPKKAKNRPNKIDLMRTFFIEGFKAASGGKLADMKSKATARQIFYNVRNTVSMKTSHKIELTQSDFNRFTQTVCTEMLEQYPELEGRIIFEIRGYFLNPLTGMQLPLGTEDVMSYISREISDKIQSRIRFEFDIQDHLMFGHVLFVEKQGFNIILKEHGILDSLNLGIMSTAGFGTRASKQLMKYFIDHGITVYVMCDCDISGYLILHKIKHGSKTFSYPLPVRGIGMTVDDVKKWGKESYAEEVNRDTDYKKALDDLALSKEEKKFFVIDEKQKKYRRVELNTLTVPELIKFVSSKIKPKPVKPTIQELRKCIQVDKEEIIKKALFEVYGDMHIDGLTINMDQLVKRVYSRIDRKQHWIYSLQGELEKYKDEIASNLVKRIRRGQE